ncbi:tripartite tricarboxylate transporter substrate binding protein [Xylophilus sp. GOD-11R]|uniref:Bug family tripartite tricarboxylate transporter substrate binding protein n=1 Tax=Xylophilus sp. GOD-11R TaxID=3089814 RepID=UPI00298CE3D2|nr:tripartite tricarboxylate transporter substrate binding protein [Xylophilus sp. GOD-11R]WPB56542.1 tripartite tricarboxylate transporter substrate binding protein [Xylophilus sp. GOD-11R]
MKQHAGVQRRSLVTMAVLAGLGARAAQAQDYPSRPVRLVIPQGPGSGADATGRQLAEFMARALNGSVVVDNKPGANGVLASSIVARERPDGYTVFLTSVSLTSFNQYLYKKLPYDPIKDFTFIAPVVDASFMVIASQNSGIKSWADFVAKARAEPGKLTYASAGLGNSTHLYMEKIARDLKLDLRHIPYKGAGPALLSVVSGETDLMCVVTVTALPQYEAGAVVALAQSGEKRAARMPAVPLINELAPRMPALPGWYALVGPAGMPPEVVQKLSGAVRAFLDDESTRKKLNEQFLFPIPGTSEQILARATQESRIWGELIKSLDVSFD